MNTNLKFLLYKDIIDYKILSFLSKHSYTLLINSVNYLRNFFTENKGIEFILFLKKIGKRCYRTTFNILKKPQTKKELINFFQIKNYRKYLKNYLENKRLYHQKILNNIIMQAIRLVFQYAYHKSVDMILSIPAKLI